MSQINPFEKESKNVITSPNVNPYSLPRQNYRPLVLDGTETMPLTMDELDKLRDAANLGPDTNHHTTTPTTGYTRTIIERVGNGWIITDTSSSSNKPIAVFHSLAVMQAWLTSNLNKGDTKDE